MVNILLGILKVIGILLAVVLSLILFVLLVILLGPICYRASGRYREDKTCSAGVSWLGFVVRARADYEADRGLLWGVRLFGILIASNDEEFLRKKEEKKRAKEERERKKLAKKQEQAKLEQQPVVIESEQAMSEQEAVQTEPEKRPEQQMSQLEAEQESVQQMSESEPVQSEPEQKPEQSMQKPAEETQTAKPKTEEKPKKKKTSAFKEKTARIKTTIKNLMQKVKSIPDKIRGFIAGIKTKIENLKAKIARMMEMKEFVFGERNKEGFQFILQNLKKMICHILPTKLAGTVEFGVEDPYVMGQILTVLSIFYPVYQDKFTIRPDFEHPGFAGDASFKGRIIPGYLLLRVLITICNKEVRRIIQEGKSLFKTV